MARSPRAAAPAASRAAADLNALAKDYIEESFERFPIWGGEAGVRKYQGALGSAAAQTFKDQAALDRRTLTRLAEIPIVELEGDARLDHLTLRSRLRRELSQLEDMQTWRTNPQSHLDSVAEALYSLVVRNADNLKPVAPALLSRIKEVPRFLEEGARCLKNVVPLWADLAVKAAPHVAAMIRALAEPVTAALKVPAEEVAPHAEAAAKAALAYGRRVEKASRGAAGGFAAGRERFEALIRDRLGLDWTADEARRAGLALAESLRRELREESRKFHPKKSAAEILAEAAAAWEPGGKDLLESYKMATEAMKSRFQAADAMTFPVGDELLVKPVPGFMAHQFPTAAYSSPGALDPRQMGIFWVNDLSLGVKGEDKRRKEIEQHFGLELTSAHEAYPGHHLQFVLQHRHPSLVRKLADHAVFYEGWTLWCEQMTIDLKIAPENPYLRLQQLQDALWRACRIIIDCGLHAHGMTFNQSCSLLVDEVGFTRARAAGDVNWYTSSPTVPMSYLIGKTEMLRLKRKRVDEGGWPLRKFNDWLLGFGAIPQSWIEQSGL